MIWNEKMECADRDTMRSVQLEKLKKTVKHAYDNVSHYRNKMDEAGVKPEDIQSLDDITKLPFITKEDIAANYPTGLFAEPMKDIVRIHASSGTTGKPGGIKATETGARHSHFPNDCSLLVLRPDQRGRIFRRHIEVRRHKVCALGFAQVAQHASLF